MKEQIITFETAKLAKGKGFKGIYPTTDYIPMYIREGELSEQQGEDDERGDFYLAPNQSLLQKWLREKHDMHVEVNCNGSGWFWEICRASNGTVLIEDADVDNESGYYDSYESALEKGLETALKPR